MNCNYSIFCILLVIVISIIKKHIIMFCILIGIFINIKTMRPVLRLTQINPKQKILTSILMTILKIFAQVQEKLLIALQLEAKWN